MNDIRYCIGDVETETGLSQYEIRSWEDRWQAIEPERTEGGHRRYSEGDIRRLKLLKQTKSLGYSEALLAKRTNKELEDLSRAPDLSLGSELRVTSCLEQLESLAPEERALVLQQIGAVASPPREPPVMDDLRAMGRQLVIYRRSPLHDQLPTLDVSAQGSLRLHSWKDVAKLAEILSRAAARDRNRPDVFSHLNAQVLIQELLTHWVLQEEDTNWHLLTDGPIWLEGRLGRNRLREAAEKVASLFTVEPLGSSGRALSPIQLWSMVLLWIANRNTNLQHARILFDDTSLSEETAYGDIVECFNELWMERLTRKKGPLTRLVEAGKCPEEQLTWLLKNSRPREGDLLTRAQRGLDFIREGGRRPKTRSPDREGGDSTAPSVDGSRVPTLGTESDWMLGAVITAKYVLPWLSRLGVQRLDEIPSSALQELKELGFNTLLLIGLWHRSEASRKLKKGAAVGSAFAATSYGIPEELGGDKGLEVLKTRCEALGITLGCDMLLNHFAIDSEWVKHWSSYFIQTPEPPLPDYSFSNDPVFDDGRIQLRIEDGYYRNPPEPAVVFQRKDSSSGDTSYLYHGNSGDEVWYDTAQVDLTQQIVRENLCKEVVAQARRFGLIRLGVAMLSIKQHSQRLFFPAPGDGGAVASRSRFGLSKEEFDQRMPEEFWTEVLNRVAEEAPGTMLLAEDPWRMERHFSSLGFPRAYSIQFLQYLRTGKNTELQTWLRETVHEKELDPPRFVHFLSAPGRRPATVEFGKGDRYFAACTLLAAWPGTPLFNHGQAEGLLEKFDAYSAEPTYAESTDRVFLDRHRREIRPLLEKRRFFNNMAQFQVVDFLVSTEGDPIKDVFAFTNRNTKEAVLVIVNHSSTWWKGQITPEDETLTLAQALGNPTLEDDGSLIGKDLRSGELIRLSPDGSTWSADMPPYGTVVATFPLPKAS